MCGITGMVRFDGADVDGDVVEEMTQAIAHRGPDGEGVHLDGSVGIGNRRLAIIDLSEAGAQPMSAADGDVWITYNGETYNFQELREELEDLGHSFRSQSDTEVVLHAYLEWGRDCVERLNGMFALAIWDARDGTLLLARDRYGVKPLYIHRTDERLMFGSEVKALLASGDLPREVDPVALREYFTFQNIYSDRTLFDGVRLLPPGHRVVVDVDAGTVTRERYFDFDLSDPLDPDDHPRDDCAKRLREKFEQAVERQLVSDVPLGSFLSGGMDSGSIVAVASRKIPRLKTFTGGFDLRDADGIETAFDERKPAELMAVEFGTEHYEMVMHGGDMEWVMPRLIWHLEDLRLGMCWQNYYIQQLASRFVKVTLSGAGGDELFAGYPWRYHRIDDVEDPDAFRDAYFDYWQRLVPQEDHGEIFTDEVLEASEGFSARQTFESVLDPDRLPDDDHVPWALYFELKTFLHGLFVIGDKLSMAHSMEMRVPFLDDDLVDYALRLPSRYKFSREDEGVEVNENEPGHKDKYLRQSNEGKRILRQAMRGLAPDAIIDRKKQGFSPPDASWYRTRSLSYLKEVLLDDRTLERGYLRPEFIRRTLDEHEAGKENHRLLIWSMLAFEWWCRLFLDEEHPPEEARPPQGGPTR